MVLTADASGVDLGQKNVFLALRVRFGDERDDRNGRFRDQETTVRVPHPRAHLARLRQGKEVEFSFGFGVIDVKMKSQPITKAEFLESLTEAAGNRGLGSKLNGRSSRNRGGFSSLRVSQQI